MTDITNQTEIFVTYLKAMMHIAPALCSLACALFMWLLICDFRNSLERLLRLSAASSFLFISTLWLLLFVFTSIPNAPSTAIVAVRMTLFVLPFGGTAIVLTVRYTLWRRVDRIDPENALSDKHLRYTVIIAAAAGIFTAGGIVLTLFAGDMLWNAVCMVVISFQQVALTYYTIRRQHLEYDRFRLRDIQKNSKNGKTGRYEPVGRDKPHEKLSKHSLEEYFKLKRPYLDPEFRLTDLAEVMEVNRSEISAFVNRTFGMNFKRYVNRWRIAEYERLMSLPSNEMKNPYKILPMAGFTDSRHYHRALTQEREHGDRPDDQPDVQPDNSTGTL